MIGELTQTGAGWAVAAPTECIDGNSLGPGEVLVSNQPCTCEGCHMGWTCLVCDATFLLAPDRPHLLSAERCCCCALVRRWRLLLLAQANAFTGVLTGAGDTLDLRQSALRGGGHTYPGGVLHLTHEALGDLRRHAGRWYGEDGDRWGGSNRDRESTGKD